MGQAVQESTAASYADWQRWLAHAWFGRPGAPVVLFADDDELAKVAPTQAATDPAGSLANAVLQHAPISAGGGMFSGFRPHIQRWRRSPSGPPPTLPVLALTVLAAARMQRDDQGAASAYYLRLAQALLPEGPEWRVQHVKALLPAAFQRDIAPMWRQLHEWLVAEGGSYGLSTIREHPHFTYIGYPLSQALVRASDRAVLTRFFAAIDVTGSGVPESSALMNYLRLWTSRPRGLSGTLRTALADAALSDMVAPLLAGLASAWDGHVVTSDGRTRLELQLVLDLDEWRSFWTIPLVDGVGPEVLRPQGASGAGEQIQLSAPEYGRYFHLSGTPVPTGEAVLHGARFAGKRVSAEFAATRIVAFRDNAHAGGWTSCEALEPYAEHMLAVHPDLATQVVVALTAAAEPGWRLVRQNAGAPLLPGFELFRRVRFSDEAKLDRALRPLQDYVRAALRPAVAARPRLGAGLPLLRGLSGRCYLSGGEPDLYLPSGEEPRAVDVRFDGYQQTFRASGFPIPFAILPDIATGEHAVEADGETLRFHVLERSPAEGPAPGTAALAWDAASGVLVPRTGAQGLCGAHLGRGAWEQERPHEPLLVRRGAAENWWLHSNGACLPLAVPAPAPLVVDELGLTSPYAEVMPPSGAAWLLQRRHRGWATPVLLRRLAPEFTRHAAEARAVLDEAFGPAGPVPSGEHAGLWALYRRAWGHQRDR